jgi:hypothetical protein
MLRYQLGSASTHKREQGCLEVIRVHNQSAAAKSGEQGTGGGQP